MRIGTLGEGDFFEVVLEKSLHKNSEYESQTKKMIPIVFLTIYHLWSPTLTIFWEPVFVPLFSIVYTPLPPSIHKYFYMAAKTFLVSCS